MDQILINCLKMILRRQKYNNTVFGLVAAAIITNDYSPVYETSIQTISGKWKHAERCVIDKFHRLYGELPEDVILITTLSPCFVAMNDRYGESCNDLITEFNIKKIYAGIADDTQLNYNHNYYKNVKYDIEVTKNKGIKDICQKLLERISKLQEIS